MVDTCAAEFDAATPYFYSTYEEENEAEPMRGNKAVVIGSGPIRIGQGIEFDYCSVHSAWALQEAGYKSIMVNSNPETVSTDFDTSDRLYFEALDEESLRDILENEAEDNHAPPSIVQFGGQTAINLAEPLFRAGMPILGSSAEAIDLAEDRRRFENFLSSLGIPQPPGAGVTSIDQALNIAQLIGYPVLVRPSYVLGGRAMEIVHNASELVRYMSLAMELDTGHAVLIDKYLQGKEVEVDAIGDGETVLIPGIMEHIERAGVHSGDSMAVYPGVNLTDQEVETIVDYTIRIGLALKIKGLMNIQFVIAPSSTGEGSSVYVLEVNPRASRTVPFLSKVTGVPMVKVATKVMLGQSLKEQGYRSGLWPTQKLIGIKAPVFSMSKSQNFSGLRIGYLYIEDEAVLTRVRKLLLYTTNGINSITQWAAIEALKPESQHPEGSPEWLLYNILDMRFIQGRRPKEIADRLAISESDLYRKQKVAIEQVAKILAEMERREENADVARR
mgnify:CR=1 FL=1